MEEQTSHFLEKKFIKKNNSVKLDSGLPKLSNTNPFKMLKEVDKGFEINTKDKLEKSVHISKRGIKNSMEGRISQLFPK